MPRKTASKPAAPQDRRPFSPDAPDALRYGALDAAARKAVAESIAADKVAGLSGNELRAKYGDLLTGPARRKVLREHALASPATIARSYSAYRDGDSRSGSRHAREHGTLAQQRRREAAEANAAATPLAFIRKELRGAGLPVPRNEQRAREAYVGVLLSD